MLLPGVPAVMIDSLQMSAMYYSNGILGSLPEGGNGYDAFSLDADSAPFRRIGQPHSS